MSEEKKVLVDQSEVPVLLRGLPSVFWLFVIVGAKLLIDAYVPAEYTQWAILATLALFSIGKAFGVSKEQILTTLDVVSGKVPYTQAGVTPAGAPAPQPEDSPKPSRVVRFLF